MNGLVDALSTRLRISRALQRPRWFTLRQCLEAVGVPALANFAWASSQKASQTGKK
jgi:hypothetical protein